MKFLKWGYQASQLPRPGQPATHCLARSDSRQWWNSRKKLTRWQRVLLDASPFAPWIAWLAQSALDWLNLAAPSALARPGWLPREPWLILAGWIWQPWAPSLGLAGSIWQPRWAPGSSDRARLAGSIWPQLLQFGCLKRPWPLKIWYSEKEKKWANNEKKKNDLTMVQIRIEIDLKIFWKRLDTIRNQFNMVRRGSEAFRKWLESVRSSAKRVRIHQGRVLVDIICHSYHCRPASTIITGPDRYHAILFSEWIETESIPKGSKEL